MSYFGCTCDALPDRPHCHTSGNCPPETPSTIGRRYCTYGGIGCNVDHDAIALKSADANAKADYAIQTAPFR